MKLGVCGLGFMGATHLKALRSVPEVTLVAVCSPDDKQRTGDLSGVGGNTGSGGKFDFAGIARWRRLEDLLADTNVDAVDLCLPTYLHEPAAIAALRAGKHVLVEKPMALDAAACGRMMDAARSSGKVLMTAQVLRFFPVYAALRTAVPRLGQIRAASFRRRCAMPGWGDWLKDVSRSGGAVLDLLIHDIDMCLHLFGQPSVISATGFQDVARGIDILDARLHYAQGFTASIQGGWHPGEFPFSMEYSVVGDGGAVEYSSADASKKAPTLYSPPGTESLALEDTDGYAAEIAYFAECCRTGAAPARCRPRESAAAVSVARQLEHSRTRNGEIVSCQ